MLAAVNASHYLPCELQNKKEEVSQNG